MTLPTPEVLREAAQNARALAALLASGGFDETTLDKPLAESLHRDLETLSAAADLLLSEEWQGMATAAKAVAVDSTDEAFERFTDAGFCLARKLAAQEEEK